MTQWHILDSIYTKTDKQEHAESALKPWISVVYTVLYVFIQKWNTFGTH